MMQFQYKEYSYEALCYYKNKKSDQNRQQNHNYKVLIIKKLDTYLESG